MGIFATGLAHELNNPIGSILLAARNAELAPDRLQECLETIRRNARRCARLIEDVMRVAGGPPGQRAEIGVSELVDRAVAAASDQIKHHHVRVELALDSNLAPVRVNVLDCELALSGLIRNAAQAGRGHCVRIETQAVRGGVRIIVHDNGEGMPDHVSARAFEPFFTTRQDRGGTGLGLSLLRAVAHAHSGTVAMRSREGEGTRIEWILPRDGSEETE